MGNVITLDGPAGAGKSTVGKLFAKKIGFQFLDTGILYRAGAAFIINHTFSLTDIPLLIDIFSQIDFIYYPDGKVETYVKGENVTSELYTDKTSQLVPEVAAIKEVREEVKRIQWRIAKKHDLVIAGRDIGSEIFPDAKYKFFLTATPEVRAHRRLEQLENTHPSLTFTDVLASTKERDLKDTTRKISPMRQPEGAVVIDTSKLSIDQVVNTMMDLYSINS